MPPATDQRRLIYSLDRERTYHFVTGVLALLAVLVAWVVSLLTPEAMIAGVGSVAAGRILQGSLLLIGVAPLPAWLWWMRRYVRRLTWLPDEQKLLIERCGNFARAWKIAPTEIISLTGHDGVTQIPDAPDVHAPYRTIRIRGRPALILDDQGTTHAPRMLNTILSGQSPT